jgi:hypothetical protein
MFYLIDVSNMTLVRKHSKPSILNDLATIECGNVATLITDLDDRFFASRFTDFELKRLYKAVTSQELKHYFVDGIMLALRRALEAFPEDEINPHLALAQANYAIANNENDDGKIINYRYKAASVLPETLLDFDIPVPRSMFAANPAFAAGLPSTVTLRAAAHAVAPAEATAAAVPKPTPAAPAAHSANPHIGTRGAASIVIGVADEMWKAAGSPRDISILLQLRKKMMDHLEAEYGIKRTTASTALGGWQKTILEA